MNKKISQLDLVTNLDQNDVLPIVNEGVTKKVKISQLPSSETNLSYTPTPTNGTINNDNGTNATIPLASGTNAGLFSSAEKTKLSGIEAGAEKNVNADWNALSGDAQILNKPSIPTATSEIVNDSGFITIDDLPPQENADWNATSGVTEILNKPIIPTKTSDLINDSYFVSDPNYVHTDNNFTNALKTKLDGIQAGAEVNVNADWNATSGDAQILNKPTIPTATSDLTNDSGFITTNDIVTPSLQQVLEKGNETDTNIIIKDSEQNITYKQNELVYQDITDGGDTSLRFLSNSNPGVKVEIRGVSGTVALLSEIPNSNDFVPYINATNNLDLGTYNLTADHIALNTNPSGAGFVEGATQWNNDIGSSQTLLKGGNVAIKNGVDLVARVVNKVVPNTTLTKAQYQVVKVTGAQGQRLAIDLAQADNDNNSADTLGVVIETIATNQEGFILTVGQIEDINTTGSLQGEVWADGDVLYLSPTTAGAITNVKPNATIGHIVVLGYVEYAHPNQGKIYVKIMNGWELDELHNVYINTPLNNQGLIYKSSSQLWENQTIDKTLVGLENVDNTSDVNKPVSTAQQNALNLKQNIITLTTNGTSGASTFNSGTGALNIPQYGFHYSILLGFNSSPLVASNTYVAGCFYNSSAITLGSNKPSRWILAPKTGTIVSASIIAQLNSPDNLATPSNSVMTIRVHNLTQGTNSIITNAFPIGSGLTWSGSPRARNELYSISNLAVNVGDQIQIQIVTPAWTTAPSDLAMNFLIFIE
jgi:hypothetical protein